MLKRRWLCGLLAVALGLWVAAGWAADQDAEAKEAELGKRAAEQIEKQIEVAEAPEQVARLDKIVARLLPHTQRPEVTYTVKVLADGDINAFSLPGGYVYVTQGTLKAVESEHELAAVLAHEMAHNCHKHGMDLLRREAKINTRLGLVLLAVLAGGGKADAGNTLLFGQLVKQAVLTGHTREAEYVADKDSVLYMQRASYNPVAMLTVMEGFARLANTRPHIELGVFQTHPYPDERAQQLVKQLKSLNIPINRRLVTRSLVVRVQEEKQNDPVVGQILVDDALIFETAVGENGSTPTERAAEIGGRLSRQILDNLQVWEIQASRAPQDPTIYARGEPLIRVLPEDAALQETTQNALARQVLARLQMAFWREHVARSF